MFRVLFWRSNFSLVTQVETCPFKTPLRVFDAIQGARCVRGLWSNLESLREVVEQDRGFFKLRYGRKKGVRGFTPLGAHFLAVLLLCHGRT